MPSAPSAIAARAQAERPVSHREHLSNDWYEEFSFTLPATTAFSEACTFSGYPSTVIARVSANTADVVLKNPGEAAGSPVRIQNLVVIEIGCGGRTVLARDPTGAGGGVLSILARYPSRNIDVRESRRGPVLSHTRQDELQGPTQYEPR